MKNSIRFALAAGLIGAAAANPSFATIDRSFEKTFTVQPGGTLHLETEGGSIRVETSTDPVVIVTAKEKIRANNDGDADRLLANLSLSIEQQGNEIFAVAKYDDPQPNFHFGSWPPVQVDFVVKAPASFAAELKTSGGNIWVEALAGPVQAHTSGGSLKLGRIGGDVKASTSGGNASLEEGRAAVDLRTSGGSISVGHAVGPTVLETSGGSIRIESAENTLHASTSGGSVRAGMSGPIKGDCVLKTSGGSVSVMVDRTAGFYLDAKTSGGGVDVEDLAVSIAKGGPGKSEFAGSVNGGGPLIKLRTSGGGIEVETR